MDNIIQIDANFIEEFTAFPDLISEIKAGFASNQIMVPQRHHHDFPNPDMNADSTMLLMPAWNPGKNAGVKIIAISPENHQFSLPSIQGTYVYLDAKKGTVKAIIEAKSLTAKRTAATSALAASFLSKKGSSSLMMIGTGVLSSNLIMAHASMRPITEVYIWGRDYAKAQAVCNQLQQEDLRCTPVRTIQEKISEVDIISCATLSKTPLILGEYITKGQHVDLVGAYKPDMREADDALVKKASVFIDTFDGKHESGDLAIPLASGVLDENAIKADLFQLCSGLRSGRKDENEITLFKSVGHALEDLVAANYFYNKFANA